MTDILGSAWQSVTRHRLRSLLAMAGVAVGVCAVSGCGHRAAHKPAPTPAVPKVAIPLPEWAPQNPSPEFLRAARVLKPIPSDLERQVVKSAPEGEALLARVRQTYPSAWEFFGTLDDRNIERFRETKEIRIPTKLLTQKQRTAFNHWVERWRTAMKGAPPEFQDYLVLLYKMGARDDLSNVDVGFTAKTAGGGHLVHIYFWVKAPDGKVNDFGTICAEI